MKSRQTTKIRHDSSGHDSHSRHNSASPVTTSTKTSTTTTSETSGNKTKATTASRQHHHNTSSSSSGSEFGSPNDFPRLAQFIRHENSIPGKNAQLSEAGMNLLEDVDAIQMELEALWINIRLRIRTLKASQIIVNEPTSSTSVATSPPTPTTSSSAKDQCVPEMSTSISTGARGSSTAKSSQSSLSPVSSVVVRRTTISTRKGNPSPVSVMKAAIISRRSKKKLRGDRNSTTSTDSKCTNGSTKPTRSGQNRSHSMSQDSSFGTTRQPAPGHFWDFVDSFCRDLTYDDLEALEKTVAEHGSAIDGIFDIPPLGKHFRAKDTENSSARLTREKLLDRSRDVCGPLTQRLVSALVDNRVHNYNKNGETAEGENDGFFINRPGLATALGLEAAANGVNNNSGALPGENNTLESRLKKIFTEQGFLLPEGNSLLSSIEEKDEILADILRTQDNLRSLHKNNAEKLEKLQALAKREIMRSQVKLEMEKADKEVLEAYRLISTSRAKKKPLSRRERDLAARALDHRRAALGKLRQPESEAEEEVLDQ